MKVNSIHLSEQTFTIGHCKLALNTRMAKVSNLTPSNLSKRLPVLFTFRWFSYLMTIILILYILDSRKEIFENLLIYP